MVGVERRVADVVCIRSNWSFKSRIESWPWRSKASEFRVSHVSRILNVEDGEDGTKHCFCEVITTAAEMAVGTAKGMLKGVRCRCNTRRSSPR